MGRQARRRARRASLAAGVVGVAALTATLAVVLTLVDSKSPTVATKAGYVGPDRRCPRLDDVAHVDARRRSRRDAADRGGPAFARGPRACRGPSGRPR